MIGAEKSRSTRLTVNIVAGFVALIGALGAWQFVDAKKRDEQTAAQLRAERAAADAKLAGAKAESATKLAELDARANLSKRVKAEYGGSTVYIEAAWRFTESASGKQVYHRMVSVGEKNTPMPAYQKMEDGSYEPLLELNDRGGRNKPIGGAHSGTGFVVSDNGLIMTNRHVAAAWHAPYPLPFPGVVVEQRQNEKKETELVATEMLDEAPSNLQNWVPSRSKLIGSRGVGEVGGRFAGSLISMSVSFPNSKLRIPATLGTISPEHDVALVKIEASTGHLKKVEMRDRGDTLASGDVVAVLGYPSVAGKAYVVTASSDALVKGQDVAIVPEVSVNQGIVSKVSRGNAQSGNSRYVSSFGDTFEMSVNSTGQGNSGGPVFDAEGKVIGIFSMVSSHGYATQTGAVPIRYGLELLDPTRASTSVASNR